MASGVHADSGQDQLSRIAIACFLAWLLPGAGHLYLRKYWHAAVYFVTVTLLLVTGTLINGELHSLLRENSNEGFLQWLAALGNLALGAYHFLFYALGLAAGDVTMRSYEYGTTFIISAALINLLVILDAFDHARGVRQ
jgi:hypothetical protein